MPKSNPQPYYLKTEFLERYAFGPYDEDHRLKAMAAEILRLHEIIDGLIEGAREVIVPGAAHWVLTEKPQEVNQAIESFLASL